MSSFSDAHQDDKMEMSDHILYMRRALEIAEFGWGQTAPNPMVGAVVVSDGIIVGEGYHARFGESHAEVNAIRMAGEAAAGSTIYVTLEPCNHHGSTPPCTDSILRAGIKRVVYATRDPNPKASGGAEKLKGEGVEVIYGVAEAEAKELNAAFFASFILDRPFITVKLALSIDGAIADSEGNSKWITGEASRFEVQRLRANSDAIAVGAGTVDRDNPSLTARFDPPPRIPPKRVVFDRNGRVADDRTVVQTRDAIPLILARDPDMETALRKLKLDHHNINSLFVEGGAGVVGELFKGDFVDRLVIFQAPLILGQGALNAFSRIPSTTISSVKRYPVIKRQLFGEDIMTVYAIHSL